jgi:lipopolysaccharide export system permease protein
MRVLDRYLLREFLVPLGFILAGLWILSVAFDLTGELRSLQEKHLLARDVAEYYVFKAPEFAIVVLPTALLLAALYALTNHARHNEITAIRAAGVSLVRLCVPYVIIGVLASVGLFALDEYAVPRCTDRAEQILRRRLVQRTDPVERHLVRPLLFVNSSVGGDGRKWQIATYNKKTFEMLDLQVQWPLSNGASLWLKAERGNWTNGTWVFSGKVTKYLVTGGPMRPLLQTNELAMPEFTETPEDIRSEININSRFSLRSNTRRADIPLSEVLTYLRLHPRPEPARLRWWLYTKLHGRLAGPWACLVYILLGIPFAAASGRRNVFAGVAASIFICFTYFILQQFGFAFGAAGTVPPWLGAWFPNLFFGIAGLVMMARVR